MGGDGGGRFHTQTVCISRIIKFDSKQKKKTKLNVRIAAGVVVLTADRC
jgi:hypothetical protein